MRKYCLAHGAWGMIHSLMWDDFTLVSGRYFCFLPFAFSAISDGASQVTLLRTKVWIILRNCWKLLKPGTVVQRWFEVDKKLENVWNIFPPISMHIFSFFCHHFYMQFPLFVPLCHTWSCQLSTLAVLDQSNLYAFAYSLKDCQSSVANA